jgi:hypothetical protein
VNSSPRCWPTMRISSKSRKAPDARGWVEAAEYGTPNIFAHAANKGRARASPRRAEVPKIVHPTGSDLRPKGESCQRDARYPVSIDHLDHAG